MRKKIKVSADEFARKFKAAMKRPDAECYTTPDLHLFTEKRRIVKVGPISLRIIPNGPKPTKYFASVYGGYERVMASCEILSLGDGKELCDMVDKVIYEKSNEFEDKFFNEL